jgi:hypothetical protein
MKTFNKLNISYLTKYILIFIPLITLAACVGDDIDEPFSDWQETSYEPLIMNRSVLEKSIEYKESKPLSQTGKIYSYGVYILINEKYEGVHVFNNADPRNPQKIGFINVPGCVDMAVKDGILYVDNAVDLVAIDINAFPEISVTERVRSIFPELTPPDLTFVPHEYSASERPDNTVIVKWVKQ